MNPQSDLSSPSPSGGRAFRVTSRGYQIWIPESWRMDSEPDPEHPNDKFPIWYREPNGIGTLRVTALRIGGNGQNRYDPGALAREQFERYNARPNVKDCQLESASGRPTLSFNELTHEGQIAVSRYLWMIYDPKGMLVLTFVFDAKKIDTSDIRKELDQVQEIVKRIVHL